MGDGGVWGMSGPHGGGGDTSDVTFKDILSLSATKFGVAVVRPDGTCVSVCNTKECVLLL